jgi:hypothetical protein
MKRLFLLFIIIGMCLIVAVGGTMTFINSNSVLKQENQSPGSAHLKDIKTNLDAPEDKVYPISPDEKDTSSPKGEETIGQYIDISSPWGKVIFEYLYR